MTEFKTVVKQVRAQQRGTLLYSALIASWTQRLPAVESKSDIILGHGVTIDARHGIDKATVIVNSRLDQCFRRFTLDGQYIETISLPGAYVHRAVMVGDLLYAAVCWSQRKDVAKFGGIEGIDWNPSGFVVVLDKQNRVISCPGGIEPEYIDGNLQPLRSLESPPLHHPHDVHVLANGDMLAIQWIVEQTFPFILEKLPV